jgi:hypothetical protein
VRGAGGGGVARDHVEGRAPAVRRDDGADAAVAGLDRLDVAAETDRAAELAEPLHERPHEGAGPAEREEDAPLALEVVDQRVDRRRAERVAADQKRVEAEGLPQVRVADEARHGRVDRAVGLQAHQLRGDPHHAVGERQATRVEALDQPFVQPVEAGE